jgi:hypothetical protein
MFSGKRLAAVLAVVTGTAMAQPALTTIQDVLYRADGSRFSGTVRIKYQSFQSADTSAIATANLNVTVVNGSLRVRLVPTTNATAGAQYNITYNSNGIDQFTESWAVPPSTSTLRVRDVRTSSGSVIGPPPVVSPVQIGDVIGLANELEVRPMRGVSYTLGRAAIINSSGQLDGAAGSLSDCVRVDGSAGPCGGGGNNGLAGTFADNETPSGLLNSSNRTFVLAHTPDPVGSLNVFRNGVRNAPNVDYSVAGNTITFFVASTPQTGDQLVANYRYGDPGNPLGSLTSSQVVCSGVGGSTSSNVITQVATCTIPQGVLVSGDRFEIRTQWSHAGTASDFGIEVRVGGTTVLARTAPASEARVVSETDFALTGLTQLWNTSSFGTTLPLSNTAGDAAEPINTAITITFRGQLLSASADSVTLRNFTVIRYPAQVNP